MLWHFRGERVGTFWTRESLPSLRASLEDHGGAAGVHNPPEIKCKIACVSP